MLNFAEEITRYTPNSLISSEGSATDIGGNSSVDACGTADNCAYYTNRSFAATRRNYGNCLQCKRARQKCTPSDGGACVRCTKLKKPCSPGPAPGGRRSSTLDEDEQLFGRVVYKWQCGAGLIEVIHVKTGNNGVEQAFRSRCDQNGVPIAAREYLGPWADYYMKLKESSQAVDIDAMCKAVP